MAPRGVPPTRAPRPPRRGRRAGAAPTSRPSPNRHLRSAPRSMQCSDLVPRLEPPATPILRDHVQKRLRAPGIAVTGIAEVVDTGAERKAAHQPACRQGEVADRVGLGRPARKCLPFTHILHLDTGDQPLGKQRMVEIELAQVLRGVAEPGTGSGVLGILVGVTRAPLERTGEPALQLELDTRGTRSTDIEKGRILLLVKQVVHGVVINRGAEAQVPAYSPLQYQLGGLNGFRLGGRGGGVNKLYR